MPRPRSHAHSSLDWCELIRAAGTASAPFSSPLVLLGNTRPAVSMSPLAARHVSTPSDVTMPQVAQSGRRGRLDWQAIFERPSYQEVGRRKSLFDYVQNGPL